MHVTRRSSMLRQEVGIDTRGRTQPSDFNPEGWREISIPVHVSNEVRSRIVTEWVPEIEWLFQGRKVSDVANCWYWITSGNDFPSGLARALGRHRGRARRRDLAALETMWYRVAVTRVWGAR